MAPALTDGELLHLAVCLAYQEVGIEHTGQAWGALSPQQRRFYEVAAREFLAALAVREQDDGRGRERVPGARRPGDGGG